MKFNGATFNKAQQDQLKNKVGAELDDVVKKVEDVDTRMLNYMGDWVTGNEYKKNDVVTYSGNLYEVVQSGTSNTTPDATPSMYKAMTETKYIKHTYSNIGAQQINEIINIFKKVKNGKNVYAIDGFTVYTPSLVGSYTEAYSITIKTQTQQAVGLLINCLKIENNQIVKVTYDTATSTITTNTITTIDIIEEV